MDCSVPNATPTDATPRPTEGGHLSEERLEQIRQFARSRKGAYTAANVGMVRELIAVIDTLTRERAEQERKRSEFFDAFTARPCTRCGGTRDWQIDGQLQAVCHRCAYPEIDHRPAPPERAPAVTEGHVTDEMVNAAMQVDFDTWQAPKNLSDEALSRGRSFYRAVVEAALSVAPNAPTSAMVERAAWEIAKECDVLDWDHMSEPVRQHYCTIARRALPRAGAGAVPEGHEGER